MSDKAPPLPYWPVPIPEGPIYDSSSHQCEYCAALGVTVGLDAEVSKPIRSDGWMWSVKIPYARERIDEAARAGCMFFVWVRLNMDPLEGKLASAYPPSMRDDASEGLDCDLWFVFRFVMSTLRTRPPAEEINPSNIDCVDFSIRTKSHRWDHFLTTGRTSHFRDRIQGFQPKTPGVDSCLYGHVASPAILLQIRDRLSDCFQYHDECHRDSISRSGVRPTRFLDVDPSWSNEIVNLRTLDMDSRRPYVTLSYVWGHDQDTKTTMATIKQHESGIAINTLPATIRDAILVTRLLGVDLLWVDSLCIVQDNPDEVAIEIANMASYYGNALLTLSVATARSCSGGFLEEDRTGQPMDWVQFEIPFISSTKARLRMTLQPVGYQRHAIDERAWALQETLLSKRLVTIGPQATSWSCPTVAYGNILFRFLRRNLRDFKQTVLNQKHAVLTNVSSGRPWKDHDPAIELASVRQLLASPYLIDACRQSEDPDELHRWYTAEKCLFAWFYILSAYTSLLLSDPLDILNGISGIAQELAGHFPDNPCGLDAPKYLAGLWWSHYLPVELLWKPFGKCSSSTVYTAPSWSWASIKNPFKMHLAILNVDSRCFQNIRIETCHIERRRARAPYGAVTGGHLVVRGRVIRISTESAGLIGTYRITLHGDTQDIRMVDVESGNKVFSLLEILTEKAIDDLSSGPGLGARGLILHENEDGTYRRIGIFGHESEIGSHPPVSDEGLEQVLKRWRDNLLNMPWQTEVLKIV